MGCGTGLAKFILIFFNVLFWLSGACILGIGIWMRLDKNILDILEIASVSTAGEQLDNAAYIFIGFGAFVFIVGFLGCCGAWHMNRCLLGVYILFLVVVMVGELAAGILAVVLRNRIEVELKDGFMKKLKEDKYIEDPSAEELKYTAFGAAVNTWQWKFDCCGVESYVDYMQNGTEQWPKTIDEIPRNYPFSCCKVDVVEDPRDLNKDKVLNMTQCYAMDAEYFHGDGCYDRVLEEIKGHSLILIGVGIGIACLEVLVLICAIFLCCMAGRQDSKAI